MVNSVIKVLELVAINKKEETELNDLLIRLLKLFNQIGVNYLAQKKTKSKVN